MNHSRLKQALMAGGFLLWTATVLVAFYVLHKPFSLETCASLVEALAGALGAGLTIVLATGIGWATLSRMQDLSAVERLTWSAAVGLGALSLLTLALGALGILRPKVLWAVTAVGLAAMVRHLWRALRAAWSDPVWRPQRRSDVFLAGCCGILLLVGLVWALTPATAWDSLVYHLTGPKLYLETGRIAHPIDVPYLGFAQLVEMLFTWAMGLTGERAAAPVHWFYGALTLLALVSSGPRWFGKGSGWLAAAILLSARTIVSLLGWAYVDLALVAYVTLAFLGLAGWADEERGTWLVLSAICAGLALSTKYTALALGPALALALLLFKLPESGLSISSLQSRARELLALGGIALVTWSPWLVKNLILTGNPVYPFFFGGIHWDRWRAWWYDRPGTGLAYTGPWRLLTAPWDMTVWGLEGRAGYSATIGPLFLALLPVLALVWTRFNPRRRAWFRGALAFCSVLYGFWVWGIARSALLHQARLLLPAFGLFALVLGGSVVELRMLNPRGIDLGWLVQAVIVTVLVLTLIGALFDSVQGRPFHVLFGFECEEDFLKRRLGWHYAVMEHLNGELPRNSVVQFLWEPRSYYCSVDCRPDALLDRWLHTTHLYGFDANVIADQWREEGITHVLLYQTGYNMIREAGFDPVTDADAQTLRDLQIDHLHTIKEWDDVYVLYQLKP